jgi:hypothetical protein
MLSFICQLSAGLRSVEFDPQLIGNTIVAESDVA